MFTVCIFYGFMVCLISCKRKERRIWDIMKKRVVILFLCMTMVLSMGACGTDSDKKGKYPQENTGERQMKCLT